jgi:hypothetical protein
MAYGLDVCALLHEVLNHIWMVAVRRDVQRSPILRTDGK